MEEACSYGRRYTPWDSPPYQHHAPQYNAYQSNGYEDPPPPYPSSQGNTEDILQVLYQERKELWEAQKQIESQVDTLTELVTRLVTLFAASNSNSSQLSNLGDFPSQPLSFSRGNINTVFLCANQEGREDELLLEDDVESLNHEEMHEFLEEVEEDD
ncbi:hypothetical protein PIB30_041713 [Stylosanthes scabra]|uniref:Uncharacterized protein n=1 Tax=Stylosanthes scabra TaxID=79078 RepID=A0ABU6WII8_9FABA|nr:hypothetical protein [Stylosanthes scabra]